MHYSPVQMRALEAMGLVPWVQREASVIVKRSAIARPDVPEPQPGPPPATANPVTANPVAASLVAASPVTVSSIDPETTAIEAVPAPLPADAEALAHWLPLQAIMPAAESKRRYRDANVQGAGLLVLFEPTRSQPERGSVPAVMAGGDTHVGLNQDSFRLFEAMMRSIDLTQRDLTLATLSPQPMPDGETVANLLATPHRAVLLMVQESSAVTSPASTADEARFILEVPRLAGWRCPHPDSLLHEPLRKRDAWRVLKAVRRALAVGTS